MFYTLLELLDKKFNFVTVAAKQKKRTGDDEKSVKTVIYPLSLKRSEIAS